ncbi:MAG: GTP-dependent dephospho-CoA kinase family protein [Methanospirillum sp.]|nr:GTP-dependent dephospho-CoA kinase family protein [Methanospirillum sp.]
MRTLPDGCRDLFRQPFGTLYTSFDQILPLLSGKLVFSVGDVVTTSLLMAGRPPDIAVIDGQTMRRPYPGVTIPHYRCARVKNPAGGLTDELIEETRKAVESLGTVIQVEGEEDLAVVPLALCSPDGSYIIYGQPGEGVVLLQITPETRKRAEELFTCFEQNAERV